MTEFLCYRVAPGSVTLLFSLSRPFFLARFFGYFFIPLLGILLRVQVSLRKKQATPTIVYSSNRVFKKPYSAQFGQKPLNGFAPK